MTVKSTQETMGRFFAASHGDTGTLAKNVIFTLMANGDESRGPEAVAGMFQYLYHIAFDATAIPGLVIYGENAAMAEYTFTGKHIGEFAGVPATGKDVRVPFCVVYEIADDQITRGRIYFEMPVLMQQLGVKMG